MPYVIEKDDIISFRDGLFSVYKYGAGNVTLLPVRKDSRGYTVNGNPREYPARDIRREAVYRGHVLNSKLD